MGKSDAIAERLRAPLRSVLAGQTSVWPDDLRPDEIQELIGQGMAPLIYALSGVPQLRDEAIRAAAVEPIRLADLQEVLAALADREIAVLIIKGTALAYDIYDPAELRPRADTDLLIAPQSLGALREVMRALGFEERLTSGDEHVVRQMNFVRGNHTYDVHWAITNRPALSEALPFDELLARALELPRASVHARAPSRVDALALACIHRVAHHHDNERLIWLRDIVLLREHMTPAEHEGFWRLAAERRVVGICVRSIELACGESGAEKWLTPHELTREEPANVFLDREITRGEVELADFRALPWRARLERLRHLALPPPAYMEQSFGTRSRLALPWLYVYRMIRGLARLFGRAE